MLSPSEKGELIDVGGVRLHTIRRGEGPPVILLHGFPEFWWSWRGVIERLPELGFEAIAPDMRGYHRSDKPRRVSDYMLEKLVGDIRGLVEALGHDKAHIVGHDWGGAVAWATAALAPDVVDKLVIVNAPHPSQMLRKAARDPSQLKKSWYMFFFQLPLLPERFVLRRNTLARLFESTTTKPELFTDDVIKAYRDAISIPGAAKSTIGYYRAALRRPQRLPRIDAETLMLWGDQDAFLGESCFDGLEEYAPNLTIERREDLGHWSNQEDPEWVSERMAEFFNA